MYTTSIPKRFLLKFFEGIEFGLFSLFVGILPFFPYDVSRRVWKLIQSKLSLRPLLEATSSNYDHLCETRFEPRLKLRLGEQGWRSCESARLPPMCPGSIPGPGVICGLSLLVLYSAPSGFSPGTPVLPSPQKPTFNLIWFDVFDLMIWFDLFRLQSPQLVEHSCSARMNWDFNKVIIKLCNEKLP